MQKSDIVSSYRQLARDLAQSHDPAAALSLGVGGNYDAVGIIERELLIQHGLGPRDYLIDVGCGSGRLAKQLSGFLSGRYLGTDVVPEFVDHARAVANRPDWRFEVSNGQAIPEMDGQADMVCFFSIFTHLFHEQAYLYLREASRVLKPRGRVVFSFLEFRIPDQWAIFSTLLEDAYREHPLIMFMGRDAIQAWSEHSDLRVLHIIDGNVPHVPIPHPLRFDDGSTVEGMARLGPIGQSVCVMEKASPENGPPA